MKKIVLLCAAIAAIVSQSQAAILRVNNTIGVNGVYTSVTNAVNAASPGDTVHIEGSTVSYGSIYVTKKIVFTGPGYFLTDTAANPNTSANKLFAYLDMNFGPGSKGSVIQGMTIGGLIISDSFITCQRNYLTDNVYFTGVVYGDTLRQNHLAQLVGLQVPSSNNIAKGIFIYNNIFEKGNNNLFNTLNLAGTDGYFINNVFASVATGTLTFNCVNFIFQNNIFNKVTFTSAASNIFINNIAKSGLPAGNNNQNNIEPVDVFAGWSSPGTSTFSSDARYKLKTGSPAINAGILNGAAIDCGAFGGPAPYVLSGMPPVPSVYQLDVPAQINSGTPSITITVGAAAH